MDKNITEAGGNRYWVRYNATPNNLLIGDCGIRAIAKAYGIPYTTVLRIANDHNVYTKYKTDAAGMPKPKADYSSEPFFIIICPELIGRVEDIYDFKDADISLVEFTARASRSRYLKGKSVIAYVSPKNQVRENHRVADIDGYNKCIRKLKSFKGLDIKNGVSWMKSAHAVAVKDGKYYDNWDSGDSVVTAIAVIIDKPDSISTPEEREKARDAVIGNVRKSEQLKKQGIQKNRNITAGLQKSKDYVFNPKYIREHLENCGVKSKDLSHVIFIYEKTPYYFYDIDSDNRMVCYMRRTKGDIDEICRFSKKNMKKIRDVKARYEAGRKMSREDLDIMFGSMLNINYSVGKRAPFFKNSARKLFWISLVPDDKLAYVRDLNNTYTYRLSKIYGEQFWVFDLES